MIPFGRRIAAKLHRKVVMACSAQLGKTETLLDVLGQRLDQAPVPILYVGPTYDFIREQFEPRLMALLDEAPILASKVSRGKRMTKTRKVIAGVPLRLAAAGASTSLKSDAIGLAFTDELDELVKNIRNQGSPVGLIDLRGETYIDFCHAIVSTPSQGTCEVEVDPDSGLEFWKKQEPDEINSPIWALWQSGTRHHWTWPCPNCRDYFVPRLSCLKWPEKREIVDEDGEIHTRKLTPAEIGRAAYLECPRCAEPIYEHHKEGMNERGVFVAPGQYVGHNGHVNGAEPAEEIVSFWVSGLCSPFRSFGDRASKYVAAARSGDRELLQTVVNGGFGELWSPAAGDAPEWSEVAALRLPYYLRELPDGVRFITCGVDVQKRSLQIIQRGWGFRQESWLLDHTVLYGETELDDVWADLVDYLHEPIGEMYVRRVFIDSGFRPGKKDVIPEHKVYEFCRQYARVCYACKGFDRRDSPLTVKHIDVTPSGKAQKYGLDLVRLDSDFMKSWVHQRIRWPMETAGGWHVAQDVTEDYCRQVVSESRVKKASGGHIWIPRSRENHALDAEALAYAAAYMLGVQRMGTSSRKSSARPPAPGQAAGNSSQTVPPTAQAAAAATRHRMSTIGVTTLPLARE